MAVALWWADSLIGGGQDRLTVKIFLTMNNLKDLRIFLSVCRLKSMSACAKEMDLSRAVVSASLKRLEAELDTLLLVRSTRSLRLTSSGKLFLEKCENAVDLLDEAYAEIHQETVDYSGTIRLSAPSDLGRNVVLPWLDEFMERHSQLELTLELSDSLADLYSYPVDLALRYGEPKDSNLIAIPISLENRILACASPAYLERHGTPDKAQDLLEHNCLCQGLSGTLQDRWPLPSAGKSAVDVNGNRRCKDGDVTRRWAVAGRGIAIKSLLDVAYDLQDRRLVELDLGWGIQKFPLFMLCAERRLLSPMVSALASHLKEKARELIHKTAG